MRISNWLFSAAIVIGSGCFGSHDATGDSSSPRTTGATSDFGPDDPSAPRTPGTVSERIVPGPIIAGCEDLCDHLSRCTGEDYDRCRDDCIDASKINASDRCDTLQLDVIECMSRLRCDDFDYGDAPRGCETEMRAFDAECEFPEGEGEHGDPGRPPHPAPDEEAHVRAECESMCQHFRGCGGTDANYCERECGDAYFRSYGDECRDLFYDIGDCVRSLSCGAIRNRRLEDTGCSPLFSSWQVHCE